MQFLLSFWLSFVHFLLWPLYFLQQENYDLSRFWNAIPANILPKKPRQQIVWTSKLWLILFLSFEILTIFLMFIFFNFFRNDLELIIFYLRDFGNGVNFENFGDLLWYFGLFWALTLPFAVIIFPFFQSLFYTVSVLLIFPVDNLLKKRITQKAAQKVQKWQTDKLK